MQHDIIPAGIRSRLYPTLLALGALLTGYGVVTGEQWGLWVALALALTGTGTATAYRPTDAAMTALVNAAIATHMDRPVTGQDDPGPEAG